MKKVTFHNMNISNILEFMRNATNTLFTLCMYSQYHKWTIAYLLKVLLTKRISYLTSIFYEYWNSTVIRY